MRGYNWDDEVQDEIANKIGDWFKQLKSLKEVKIPRCLRGPEPVKSKPIVTFVDASQKAYGANTITMPSLVALLKQSSTVDSDDSP